MSCYAAREKYDVPHLDGGRVTSLTVTVLGGSSGQKRYVLSQCNVAVVKHRETWPETTRKVFDLFGCYAALIGDHLLTFRNSLSIPSSRVKLRIGP
jgi:hypothetical protein